jgi:hypothetical protein
MEQRMPSRAALRIASIVVLFLLFVAGTVIWGANSAGPPPGLTGGFYEQDCKLCHDFFSAYTGPPQFNTERMTMPDLPVSYIPGRSYPITIVMTSHTCPSMGFELCVRAETNGQQAGILLADDTTTQLQTAKGMQYISHTATSTRATYGQIPPNAYWGYTRTWKFEWKAPAPVMGTVHFIVAAVSFRPNWLYGGAKGYNFSESFTSRPAAAPVTALFPQVAVGGGYTTTIMLTNTGADTVLGDLVLTKSDGAPMAVFPPIPPATIPSSSLGVEIPPGGTRLVTADAPGLVEPLQGWASLSSFGGQVNGVAVFEFRQGDALKTLIGMLSTEPVNAVTIPLNDNALLGDSTGYAVANPSSEDLSIKITVVDAQGKPQWVIDNGIRLGPNQHVARFLWQDLNKPDLQLLGSLVLQADGGKKFIVGALKLKQGIFSNLPAIPGKAPNF